jgi:DNA-binding NarL/FixJ family response regulator
MYTVLLVDDQELFRDIARSMFESSGVFKVVAEALDGVDAVNLYPVFSPDLVLMDVQMARMNGFEATKKILERDPSASVVLVSMRADAEYDRTGKELGALGFIAKRDLNAESIRSMIEKRQKKMVA